MTTKMGYEEFRNRYLRPKAEKVLRVFNFIVFSTFFITSAYLFYIGQKSDGIDILYAVALYMIFIKLYHIDEAMKGG